MGQSHESFSEKQVLAVFRRTDANGNFLYSDAQATAATVFCTLTLVHHGHFTMETLPPALAEICARYIKDKKIQAGDPAKVRADMVAHFDRDIPLAMMRELNEAITTIAREGGAEAAEALARAARTNSNRLTGGGPLPPKGGKGGVGPRNN
ncbi:MAG: hypothetical protein ACAI38_01750 [Myxococcota bacterium]